MEEQKKKRGRPRKNPLPEEILQLIDEARDDEELELHNIVLKELEKRKGDWDIKINEDIPFFDPNLSYELTGYKPINATLGLDFKPEWFTEARDRYKATGHYCPYPPGIKLYHDFWIEEYTRCRDGLTVNGYTITGDHYFFLNYYQLLNTASTTKAGAGRSMDFPNFSVAQYEYLHYVEMAKRLRKHIALMKARGLGFSEMNASLVACMYSVRRRSRCIVAAHVLGKLTPTLEKIWDELSFLNDHTDGGFFKLRLVLDKADRKRASVYKILNGLKVEDGWMSLINGVIADTPDKIRGERVDMLVYEEAGSWGGLRKAVILGEALVNILGDRFGFKIIGGTGGDKGSELEGLKDIYYNPTDYDVLPFRHNFTPDGSTVLTGYFLPAFSLILKPGFLDERGWCDPVKAKAYHLKDRDRLANNPKALIDHCAEYCFTAEEAFALEGDNKFNKINITQLLVRIRALKQCPHIETGSFNLIVDNKGYVKDSVYIPSELGKVKILEHPIWIKPPRDDDENPDSKMEAGPLANLYVAGIDSIDIGLEQTSDSTKDPSKFAIIIYRRAYGMRGPLPVAIYKDRPDNEREAYKIAIGLMMYYNARANIEASRMSMITWARGNGAIKWFMKRPSATYPDGLRKKSAAIGTPASTAVIDHLTDLIRDFTDDYCDGLWFEDVLEELNSYTDDNKRKFDYTAAFGMALLADEECNLSSFIPRKVEPEKPVTLHLGYYYDERGYKKYGIIPDKTKYLADLDIESFYRNAGEYPKSSDPRNYWW